MLPTMKQQVFETVGNTELGWACMAPIMEPLRGKHPNVKLQVYTSLTHGQQILFMFYAYYNHAIHTLEEFRWWSSYYLSEPNMWSEIKARLTDFGEDHLLRLLKETEDAIKEELDESLISQYTRFHEITPMTLNRIGDYIRKNPNEFVLLEE
jgi:hypothetical protein